MAKRRAMSAKTRFEVFKRDGFVCQYCGAHPPDVLLEVDHIVAVKNGGVNDPDNLTTACERCNRGKSAVPLSSVPISLADKSAQVAERETQLQGYYAVIDAQRHRKYDETWEAIHIFDEKAKEFRRYWIVSIERFLDLLGKYEVFDAMYIARAKFPWNEKRRFIYFCGVCWRKVTEKQQAANG
jgi:DNA-directed RNA polymerase subunit RPC12/RpoP